MADALAKVIMLDRTTYDNRVAAGTIENDAIYFVREGSADTASMLSLYVGLAKQCELVDISDDAEVEFDNVTNLYTIPEKYHVPGKMFFFQQNIVSNMEDSTTPIVKPVYHLCMWDATNERFVDCSGIPNNVIVCTNGQLPRIDVQHSEAIKDFVYMDVMNRNIYVFDGNSYIPLLNLSQYATREWVQEYHDSHPTPVNVDNVTILKSTIEGVPNTLHGAGADVSGKTVTYGGNSTIVCLKGSHTFNRYQGEYMPNLASRPYSSVFGSENTELYGSDENMSADYLRGSNIIGGYSNTLTSGVDQSFIMGTNNTATITQRQTRGNAIVGEGNQLNGKGAYYDGGVAQKAYILGGNNTVTMDQEPVLTGASSFAFGASNQIVNKCGRTIVAVGEQNNITTQSFGNYTTFLIGKDNNGADSSGFTAIGYRNLISNNNASLGPFIVGDKNSSFGQANNSTVIIGHQNAFNSSGGEYPSQVSNQSTNERLYIIGSENFVKGEANTASSVVASAIFGCYNNVNIGTVGGQSFHQMSVFGHNLTNSWDNCMTIGYGNTTTLPQGVDARIIIGNDYIESGTQQLVKRNAAILTRDNESLFYGDVTDAGTDMSLKTSFRTVTVTPSSGAVTLANLPRNGDETILSYDMGDSSNPVSLTSITISDLSVPIMGTATDVGLDVANGEVDDYCATIAFKPNGSISSASDILTNFNPTGQEPRIYLMNPDIDVSTYTVIHLLLFYDGFNVCCTVAGYEEVPTV